MPDPAATLAPLPSVPSVVNLRDAGGHPTRDGGRVRTGVLYRSGALDALAPADGPAFARLGIRTVFDLRTATERQTRPDRVPVGMDYVVADMLAGSSEPGPAELAREFADPRRATERFGDGRGIAFFVRTYREFVVLDSARAAFRRVLLELADPARRPALIHCMTGKDRTGWLAAVLLLWLGVPEETALADFLVSDPGLERSFQPMLDAFAAGGGDPDVLRPLIGVRPEYLEAGLAEMRRAWGGVEAFVGSGLGIDEATGRRLRAALLE